MNAISFDDYCAIDAVNWSSLKHLWPDAGGSPLVYQHRLTVPDKDSAARKLGRVTHALVFEPATFDRDYAIYEGGDRRGKEWEAFRAANMGRDIFKPSEIDAAIAMADAVKRHALVQPYLTGGVFESTVQWRDPETGLKCKARPDWIQTSTRTLLDLKTSNTIDGRRFGLIAARYGYHCQMAHYWSGIKHGLGWEPRKTIIVAVESTAPHDVAIFEVDEQAMYAGAEVVRELLNELAARRKSGVWPGRYRDEQALQLPAYLFSDDDELESPDAFGVHFGGV